MPKETKQAIEWALNQHFIDEHGEKSYVKHEYGIDSHLLVHFVREYFNENKIGYKAFSYVDLEPFLNV